MVMVVEGCVMVPECGKGEVGDKAGGAGVYRFFAINRLTRIPLLSMMRHALQSYFLLISSK